MLHVIPSPIMRRRQGVSSHQKKILAVAFATAPRAIFRLTALLEFFPSIVFLSVSISCYACISNFFLIIFLVGATAFVTLHMHTSIHSYRHSTSGRSLFSFSLHTRCHIFRRQTLLSSQARPSPWSSRYLFVAHLLLLHGQTIFSLRVIHYGLVTCWTYDRQPVSSPTALLKPHNSDEFCGMAGTS